MSAADVDNRFAGSCNVSDLATRRWVAKSVNRSSQRVGRRRPSLRVYAIITLFFWGFAASFAHDVTVRHSLCAAHGEWVDHATTAHEVGCTRGPKDGLPHVDAAPAQSADTDDHCAIVIVERGLRWLVPTAPLVISAPLFDAILAVVVDDGPAREVRIHSTSARGPPSSV